MELSFNYIYQGLSFQCPFPRSVENENEEFGSCSTFPSHISGSTQSYILFISHIYIYIYIYACVYKCIYIYIHTLTWIHIHIHTYIYMDNTFILFGIQGFLLEDHCKWSIFYEINSFNYLLLQDWSNLWMTSI